MEDRGLSRPGNWAMAVTVSALLHGAILVGAALVPAARPLADGTPLKSQYVLLALDENDAGDVGLEAQQREQGELLHNHQKESSPFAQSTEPVAALVHDPWALSPVAESVAGTTGASNSGQESGRQASSGALRGATTSFFQVEARGARIIYVLDASASMGRQGALAAACRELRTSVQKLLPPAFFQIIVYHDQARVLLPRLPDWLAPTPEVVQAVGDALEVLAHQTPEGGTDHERALRKAFLLRPDVVFFLTDADDLRPEHPRLAHSLNQSRAVVHTIELNTRNRDRAQMPLQIMARESGGTYQAVDLAKVSGE